MQTTCQCWFQIRWYNLKEFMMKGKKKKIFPFDWYWYLISGWRFSAFLLFLCILMQNNFQAIFAPRSSFSPIAWINWKLRKMWKILEMFSHDFQLKKSQSMFQSIIQSIFSSSIMFSIRFAYNEAKNPIKSCKKKFVWNNEAKKKKNKFIEHQP